MPRMKNKARIVVNPCSAMELLAEFYGSNTAWLELAHRVLWPTHSHNRRFVEFASETACNPLEHQYQYNSTFKPLPTSLKSAKACESRAAGCDLASWAGPDGVLYVRNDHRGGTQQTFDRCNQPQHPAHFEILFSPQRSSVPLLWGAVVRSRQDRQCIGTVLTKTSAIPISDSMFGRKSAIHHGV